MRESSHGHARPGGRLALLVVSVLVMAVIGPLAAAAIGRQGGAAASATQRSSTPSGGSGLGPAVTTAPVQPTAPSTTTAASTTTATMPSTPGVTTGATSPATAATTPTTTTSGTSPYATPTIMTPPVIAPGPAGSALAKRGMWIWVMSATDGGSVPRIIAQAKASGIGTLMIKSGDGPQMWSQFNPGLVAELHAAGLHVCAWQFVYGIHPVLEARVGAQAVQDGADCLAIDAESQYEGKYVQAQTYMVTLRKLVGQRYPIALAGFPYVDYHPAFPYSVFLGPGGAQVNAPQMYWRDIKTTVPAVYAHTYEFNLLYERPIDPLGQVFGRPPAGQIHQFRSLSRSYRASGVSWWDWQEAGSSQFQAIAAPAPTIAGLSPSGAVVSLKKGALGDVVVWAQEHLVSAGLQLAIDGDFGVQTRQAVRLFQAQNFLPVTGVIDAPTWGQLLRYPPVAVTWTAKKGALPVSPGSGAATAATAARTARTAIGVLSEVLPVPRSARARTVRDELSGTIGAG